MRVVIDTNLLVSAMISPPGSTPRRLLDAVREGRMTLILSRPLIDEFMDVISRPKFARYGITIGDGLDFISELIDIASHVEITGQPRGCVDPDDDAVIETAEVGAADYLITGDPHLLKDSRIRASLGRIGIEVITARDFLAWFSLAPASIAIDQAHMIVIMVMAMGVLRLAPGSPKLTTLGLSGFGASASVGRLSASVAVKVIKPDGTAIDVDPNVGYPQAPPGD